MKDILDPNDFLKKENYLYNQVMGSYFIKSDIPMEGCPRERLILMLNIIPTQTFIFTRLRKHLSQYWISYHINHYIDERLEIDETFRVQQDSGPTNIGWDKLEDAFPRAKEIYEELCEKYKGGVTQCT